MQAVLDQMKDVPEFNQMSVEAVREREMFTTDDREPVGNVIDRTIPGPSSDLPVRIYLPDGEGPFPVVIFFPGGGFVLNGLDSHDALCRAVTNATDVTVVSVACRLAPEHPFPAAVEDAFAATKWITENAETFNGKANRIAVAGDSSGGNLAAVVTLIARDSGRPDIDYQLLIYPKVSYNSEWPSYEENDGYMTTRADMEWFAKHYFESQLHSRNPYASPIDACDFQDLPPATVVTGGFDLLRDEGVAYAERLSDAGGDVTHRHYDDVTHFFLQMLDEPFALTRAEEALDDITDDLIARFR